MQCNLILSTVANSCSRTLLVLIVSSASGVVKVQAESEEVWADIIILYAGTLGLE